MTDSTTICIAIHGRIKVVVTCGKQQFINGKINAVRNFVLSVGHWDPGIVRQSAATANSNP